MNCTVLPTGGFKLVELANGTHTVYSAGYHEKMHPGLGPAAEADLLYVRQLKIRDRLRASDGDFVVWDVGLGAAANAIAVLRATRDVPRPLRMVSFDNSREPLEFALANVGPLGYFNGYERWVKTLLENHAVCFSDGAHQVDWQFRLGDFPSWCARVAAGILPAVEPGVQPGGTEARMEASAEPKVADPGGKLTPSLTGRMSDATPPPHAILFDAFSPARNPAMWTLPLFTNLFRRLDPGRPCNLTTYSRSTMLRVTLLLAGFFVGRGVATGLKEETTVAANTLELIEHPLDNRWLERARRSDTAEPLREQLYRRARLSPRSWEKLQKQPQFV
jgi:hypothetical protein